MNDNETNKTGVPRVESAEQVGENRVVMRDIGPCECGRATCDSRNFEMSLNIALCSGTASAEMIRDVGNTLRTLSADLVRSGAMIEVWLAAAEGAMDAVKSGMLAGGAHVARTAKAASHAN